MDFNCIETIKYPLATVWETMRDHLPEIAALQDDIEYVKVDKRVKKKPDSVHVISTWKADPPLPSFLKGFIKPEMLIWTDDAVWDNENFICHFDIATHYKIEDITCVGSIKFDPAGTKSTKITYSGILTIKKTPKSSIFMTGFIIKGIEAVAAPLIARNFSKVVKALADTIKSQK
jgi:hypothetical protein